MGMGVRVYREHSVADRCTAFCTRIQYFFRSEGKARVGTTTHRIESSSTDRTHSRRSLCVLCYQWVASITTAVFIGTHTPDFESVRTDSVADLGSNRFNCFTQGVVLG